MLHNLLFYLITGTKILKKDALYFFHMLFHGTIWTLNAESKWNDQLTYNVSWELTYFSGSPNCKIASLDTTWPQTSFIGGLVSVVCCLRIGHANTEWYLCSGFK